MLPHRQQPTRLHHPWDSPGKNTGVSCQFLLQCMKVKVKSLSSARLLATPWTAATKLLCPWDFPGKSTGVGCHCLLCCEFIPFSKFGKSLSSLQILLWSHSFSLFFGGLLMHGFGCLKFFYISLILQIFFSHQFIHFVSFWIVVNFPCSQQCPISH